MTEEEREIWELIRRSNRAWIAGAAHEVSGLFDDDAVVVAPGLEAKVQGREAIVRSYEDYVHHARTHAFEELEHQIDVFGDIAVAAYRFTVRYTLNGEDAEREETGQEMLVLRRGPGGWKVIWRTQTLE
ncbi:MAG TPA: nuclear transport factor 2 family protein [Myxococcales bacterium]|nr:nuclear transport factor 2 family protein [Myxococcales bacterium]